MNVPIAGQTMEARTTRLAFGIGWRTFQLDAGQFGLTATDVRLAFSSWGLDDFYHTAIVPAEDERDMLVLEETRDLLVPTRRIGYPGG